MSIRTDDRGFTLIELSIVLVIIGLIVGGILVGQDLIRAAEIRATVAQIEKYRSAVNTFRTKFNGIPGDLQAASATAFGLATRAGSQGRGDGNGLIEGFYGGTGGTNTNQIFSQEAGLFWNDLSVANLVDGNFTGAQNQDGAGPNTVSSAQIASTFPSARLGRGNYVTCGSTGGYNYYLIAGLTSVVSTGNYTMTVNLTPIEAFNMDNKMDDGMPNTGTVQAHGTAASTASPYTDPPTSATGSVAGNCVMGDAGGTAATDTYNVNTGSGGTTPACAVRFRFN